MKMKKAAKKILAFGMLICMIVSLFPTSVLAETHARDAGAEYQLTDEWENRNPAENAIVFDGPDQVTFHSQPGELGMYTNAQNVLLYDAPDGDFTATVKVANTVLTSDFQTIGFAAFASESRVAGTMRRYHSGLGGNVFAKMNYNGNYDEYAVADTDTDAPVWLKLERSGNEIIHSYSYDGTEFTEIARTTDNADIFACEDLKIAIYTGGAETFDATVQDFTVNGEAVPFCTEKIVEENKYELTKDWTMHSPVEEKFWIDNENQVTFHSQPGELGQITDAKNVLLYDMPDGDFTATVKVTNTELTSDYQTIGLAAFANVSRVAGTMRRYHSNYGGNIFAKMNYNGSYDEAALPDTNRGDTAWLRLERSGDKFIHSYSYDGEEFTVIGETTNNADLFACEDLKIAIYTGGAQTFDAVMENFTIDGKVIPFAKEKVPQEITEIAAFENVYADYGTSLEGLNLPETAEVTLEDGTVKELAVTWDPQTYDPQTAGIQTVKGTVELEKYVLNSAGMQAEIKVHVMEEGQSIPAVKITLDRTEVTLALEGAVILNAEVFPDNAADKTVKWESSNNKAAAVDQTGKITAVGIGSAVITARSGEASAQCEVTVTDGVGIGTVWGVVSPDNNIQMSMRLTEDYGLVYEAAKNGKAFITEGSVLGLKTSGIDTTEGLTFVSAEETEIDETYETYSGKFSEIRNHANELKLTFTDSTDQYLYSVIARVYDDGAAFRYELDAAEGNDKSSVSITDEMSTVNIPEGAVTWSFENGGSYEDEYHRSTMEELGGTPAIPILYQADDLYVLFNEADLIGSDFCGSRFRTEAGSSTFELDFAREQSGPVSVQLPFESPWRYAVAGDLGTIIENTMAENLSPAPNEETYHYSEWVEPGIASWTWLAEGETREGQENIDAIKSYIDMAAELGWKYFLWDDGWQTDPANNVMNPHAQEVIDYAAERGIGILVWVNEDYIADDNAREMRFKMWSEMGIKGIKADFFDGEQQTEIAEYEAIYEDLAKYKMVGIMHGCNKATGETRTYPHILSREAIRGDEFVNRQASVQEQLTILPYIRCASGPADYTPLVDLPNKWTGEPIGGTDKTIGSQLTIPILIESGIPCMADKDTTYLREDLRGLFEDLPAAWDETRFIDGEVGEYITMARRSGDTWYIAGNTNNDARTERIDFADYIGERDEYLAQIWYDGPDENDRTDITAEQFSVTAADSIDVNVARKGGFTIKLTKTGETEAEDISTAVLEYALELAEDVDTEGVVSSVVEIFNERKAAAQDLLERAEAGDPSVTQAMIDQSWSGLIEIMQYMSFKQGDMTDLQKVVDLANSLDLTKYLDEGQQEFKDALAAAKAVLEDEFTEQSEIDQAWKTLLKAMSGLRLKPDKDALEELIASAQSVSTEGVSEEIAAVFRSALAKAVSVYEDEQADEEEVASAEEELQAALGQVLAAGGAGSSGQGNDSASVDNLTAGVQQGSDAQSSGKGGSQTADSRSAAVKTGDSMMPIAGSAAVMILAAAAAALIWKKKREI